MAGKIPGVVLGAIISAAGAQGAPPDHYTTANLVEQMEKLKAMQGKTVTTEEWADMESKLGNLQGKLGAIQGEIGAKQGSFGPEMGRLGGMQGKLGAEQGKLGAEQGRLAQQADRQVKSIIDQSLSNGKARPVE